MTGAATDRSTKYGTFIATALKKRGHATNAELLNEMRAAYPDVSATTVHRITARLLLAGKVRLAPTGRDNAMRYDANIEPHDHFMCTVCERLQDTVFEADIRDRIESLIGNGCSISGDLTVTGVCKNCKVRER